jgi:hypothetical protein
MSVLVLWLGVGLVLAQLPLMKRLGGERWAALFGEAADEQANVAADAKRYVVATRALWQQ